MRIALDIVLPANTTAHQLADVHHIVADAAKRAAYWHDEAMYSITQDDGHTVTVTTASKGSA